ncbi:MAG: hypothetical protein ACHQ6U_12515 [Thermodesulfobacteriota bacterium]
MEKGDSKTLTEIFGSDTQWRLMFDLVRAIVTDRMKIKALEKLLTDKGVISGQELSERYDELLRAASDEVINEVLQEFGRGDSAY